MKKTLFLNYSVGVLTRFILKYTFIAMEEVLQVLGPKIMLK